MKTILMCLSIVILFTACKGIVHRAERSNFKTEQDILADKRFYLWYEYKDFRFYYAQGLSVLTQDGKIIYKGGTMSQNEFLSLVSGVNLQENSVESGGIGIATPIQDIKLEK